MKIRIFFAVAFFLCLVGCEKAPAGCPTSLPSLQQATQLAQQSEEAYQQAVKVYQKIATQDPANAQAQFRLGQLYFDHGKYDLAIQTLKGCPTLPAQKLLAASYSKNGEDTEALAVFEKIGEEQDEDYLLSYAAACEKHNLYMEALKLYSKIQKAPLRSLAQARIQEINARMVKTHVDSLDPVIRSFIEKAPLAQDFPEAGTIVLYVKEEVLVHENNTVEEVQHVLVKILNERGKHLGEVEIGYDSTYEKVDVEFARTITPSGDVISAGAKHMRDVSRYLNFPLYSNARVKIISMPEVSVGAFLEYKVRTTQNKMVAEDKFNIDYFLQSDNPIQHAEFFVTLPKKHTLSQKNINLKFAKDPAVLMPQKTEAKNQVIYAWTFDNVQQIIPEPDMPPVCDITPVILLSTFESWRQIYDWWWPLAKDKMQADQAIKDKVADLVKEAKTPQEKAKAIYSFCARDIRYVGIEYGQAGYEPHPAAEIFANKYGDCKDQAILLVTMLRLAGIEAHPVLIGTKGVPKLQKDFPCLLFNHCITVAKMDGQLIFMDPTGETVLFGDLPSGDQGRDVIVMTPDALEMMYIPEFPSSHNQVIKRTILNFVDEKNIKGFREVKTSGLFDQIQRGWLRYTMPALIEETLRQKTQEILPGARLIQYRIEHIKGMESDIILSYDFTGSDFLMKAGPAAWVIPPLGGVDLSVVTRDQRLFDIDLGVPQTHVSTVEIQLPDGYTVKALPEPVLVENEWLSYKHVYTRQGGRLLFIEESISKKDAVDAHQYFQYKSMLESLSKDVRQSVIVEKMRGQ